MQLMNLVLKTIKGLSNLISPYKLNQKVEFIGRTANTETFLTECKNIDIMNDYSLRRRQGYVRKVSGNIHSLWSNGDVCYFRQGQYLKQLKEDLTTTPTIVSGLSTNKHHMDFFHLLNGQTFYSDIRDNGIIDNGVARSWGLEVPTQPTPSIISGWMREGTYLISLTYYRNDGQISGASDYIVVTITNNKGIRLSNIPTSSDSTVTNIGVWITSPNGDALYLHNGIISNGTSSYDIKNNGIESGFPLTLKGLSKMPTGDMIEFYNGKIYIVRGSNVYYSEDFSYELCNPNNNYINFTSPVTMIAGVSDGMWFGTENEIYFGKGKPPFDFIQKASYGVIKYTHKKIPGSFIGKGVDEEVVMCNTKMGVCICKDNGSFENLTLENYAMPISNVGVGLFRQDRGVSQFITSIIDGTVSERIYK